MKSFWCIIICILLFISFAFSQKNISGTKGVDAPHGDPANLPNLCADCHFGYNDPNATITINDKCLGCHNGVSATAVETHRGISCVTCHNPHHQEQQRKYGSNYSKLIRTEINGDEVKLLNSTGPNSFADGDNVYDGVCEVCHTTTSHHKKDGTGTPHHDGEDCTSCHSHNVGFAGATGGWNCLGCHTSIMGSRRAVAPDFYSSPTHHPLTYNASADLSKPENNNCLICHKDYPNLHANGVVDLNPDPDNSGSQEWNGIYADPFCMDCHDGDNPDPNYRLNGKVAPDKRSFYSSENVHRNGTGFSGSCIDCHNEENLHKSTVKFYSNFYLDDNEENTCYGCHGGAANVSTGGRYMENIKVAFTTGNINSKSKHATLSDLSTTNGKVFCRNCHDPHRLNHSNNLLIDPKNTSTPWSGSIDDFCNQCHDGTKASVPLHIGVTVSGVCSDCHLPHSSTVASLALLPISNKTLSISPSSVSMSVNSSQQFDAILSPVFNFCTQTVTNKLADWSFLTTSGGSPGTTYNKYETIPLDRSIGYDPNANGGWGLITVTSTITIPDNVTIEDLDVYFNATHHYRGDIDLTLTHVQTGNSVHVQEYSWSDWEPNLDFWYDSESPNDAHGSVSPRSTAESLSKFNGETISGDWVLTIIDTWPSDNSTDSSSPDYCKVNAWGLRVNGSIIGTFSTPGLFQTLYSGEGTVYVKIHNGKLYPAQNGLDPSVSENPLPLQSTAQLNVTTLAGQIKASPQISQNIQRANQTFKQLRLIRKDIEQDQKSNIHKNSGRCTTCHGR